MRHFGRRSCAVGMIALVAACTTSPNPALFTLRSVAGATKRSSARVVLLHRPGLPRYLDRSAVIIGMPGYRVQTGENERWAEPIGTMFNRVLIDDLSQRLPGTTITSDQGALSLSPDQSIDLEVQDFGVDRDGSVTLNAQFAIQRIGRNGSHQVRTARLSVKPVAAGTEALVAAMSEALGQLADAIAAGLGGKP